MDRALLPFGVRSVSAWLLSLALLTSGCGLAIRSAPLSFSPASGAIGTVLTVRGADFTSLQSLSIGGTPALILNRSSTQALALVMPGTSSGALSAVFTGASRSSADSFNVSSNPVPLQAQGSKMVGTGAVGAAYQGISVAVSSDGSTAIVGGILDNSQAGAVWVYTKSAGVWSQQGAKLLPSDSIGAARFGNSVALSADGTTAVIGGYQDNSALGATWVFTRSAGIWSQQGSKLVGTGAVGAAWQGYNVAVSLDGNMLVSSGTKDNSQAGAVWVFTRSGGVWSQLGSKLVGTGAVGGGYQGSCLALSADGTTLAVGGKLDNTNVGAVWVYTWNGGAWIQQGSKLVASDSVGQSNQGSGVSLSIDGNTLAVGGSGDNAQVGAAWVYTRTGGVWTQQGSKLIGTGAVGLARQAFAVQLSGDGNLLVFGGDADNTNSGSFWFFSRSGSTWSQVGTKLVPSGISGAAQAGSMLALSPDATVLFVGGYADNSNVGAVWAYGP